MLGKQYCEIENKPQPIMSLSSNRASSGCIIHSPDSIARFPGEATSEQSLSLPGVRIRFLRQVDKYLEVTAYRILSCL